MTITFQQRLLALVLGWALMTFVLQLQHHL